MSREPNFRWLDAWYAVPNAMPLTWELTNRGGRGYLVLIAIVDLYHYLLDVSIVDDRALQLTERLVSTMALLDNDNPVYVRMLQDQICDVMSELVSICS
jgi:hypothetical protein